MRMSRRVFNYQYEDEYDQAVANLHSAWKEYRSVVDLDEDEVWLSNKRMELEEKLDRTQKKYQNASKKFFG